MGIAHYMAKLCDSSIPIEQRKKALEEIYLLAQGKGEGAEEAKEGLYAILFLPLVELELKSLSLGYLAEVDPSRLFQIEGRIKEMVSFAEMKMKLLEESVEKDPRLLSIDHLILSTVRDYLSARTLERKINELMLKIPNPDNS